MTLDEAIGNPKEDYQIQVWLRELRRARMEIDLLKTLRDGFKADAQKYKAENAKLRELVLKNWYIALSEHEALRAHGIDPDGGTYIAALDEEICKAKDMMRELGIEEDK